MLEVADKDIQTFTMDHHGLVTALCKDLEIAEKIGAVESRSTKESEPRRSGKIHDH